MSKTEVVAWVVVPVVVVAAFVAVMLLIGPPSARATDAEGQPIPTMQRIAETEDGLGELWRYVDPANGHTIYAWDAPGYGGGVAVVPKR